STITTVVVFLPLGFLTGVEGQFFHALSITLTIAVLVSLLLALTIIPLLSAQFLTARDTEQETAAADAQARRGTLARVGEGIDARLAPTSERTRSICDVIAEVRDRISAAVPRLHIEFVQILSDVINDLAGAARPVEIRLFGPDLNALEAYAQKLAPQLEKVDGIEDLYNGVAEPSAEMQMSVHEAEANRVGLTPDQVQNAVSGALIGVPAGEVRLEDRSIAVRVRAPDS